MSFCARGLLLPTLLILGSLLPPPCSAMTAEGSVSKAVGLYKNLEPEKAIPLLESALARGLAAGETVRAYLFLGLSYFSLGRKKKAAAAFGRALRIDRTASLPAGESPKTRRFFDVVKAGLAPPKPKKDKTKAKSTDKKSAGAEKSTDKDRSAGAGDPTRKGTVASANGGDKTAQGTTGAKEKKGGATEPPGTPVGRVVAYSMWGTAGAALVMGTVFGLMALDPRGRLADDPDKTMSQQQARQLHDREKNRAMLSNVGFGVAGVAAAAGALFFYLSRRSDLPPKGKKSMAAGAFLAPIVSRTTLGVGLGVNFR